MVNVGWEGKGCTHTHARTIYTSIRACKHEIWKVHHNCIIPAHVSQYLTLYNNRSRDRRLANNVRSNAFIQATISSFRFLDDQSVIRETHVSWCCHRSVSLEPGYYWTWNTFSLNNMKNTASWTDHPIIKLSFRVLHWWTYAMES